MGECKAALTYSEHVYACMLPEHISLAPSLSDLVNNKKLQETRKISEIERYEKLSRIEKKPRGGKSVVN